MDNSSFSNVKLKVGSYQMSFQCQIIAGSEKRTQEDQLPTQWRAQLTVWETVY